MSTGVATSFGEELSGISGIVAVSVVDWATTSTGVSTSAARKALALGELYIPALNPYK